MVDVSKLAELLVVLLLIDIGIHNIEKILSRDFDIRVDECLLLILRVNLLVDQMADSWNVEFQIWVQLVRDEKILPLFDRGSILLVDGSLLLLAVPILSHFVHGFPGLIFCVFFFVEACDFFQGWIIRSAISTDGT